MVICVSLQFVYLSQVAICSCRPVVYSVDSFGLGGTCFNFPSVPYGDEALVVVVGGLVVLGKQLL